MILDYFSNTALGRQYLIRHLNKNPLQVCYWSCLSTLITMARSLPDLHFPSVNEALTEHHCIQVLPWYGFPWCNKTPGGSQTSNSIAHQNLSSFSAFPLFTETHTEEIYFQETLTHSPATRPHLDQLGRSLQQCPGWSSASPRQKAKICEGQTTGGAHSVLGALVRMLTEKTFSFFLQRVMFS